MSVYVKDLMKTTLLITWMETVKILGMSYVFLNWISWWSGFNLRRPFAVKAHVFALACFLTFQVSSGQYLGYHLNLWPITAVKPLLSAFFKPNKKNVLITYWFIEGHYY